MQKKALGKGIGAIFLDDAFVESITAEQETLSHVDVRTIRPNRFQPREKFDSAELAELTESIREKGILQPIIVRPLPDDNFEIIAGERRWRAAQAAGKTRVPVIIKHITENELLELALIENIQRSDLNPVETARAYNLLVEELGFTQEEVAKKVGKDRTSITNLLRLLKLPAQVVEMIAFGKISAGHGKVLLGVKDEITCLRLAGKTESEGMSVRRLETLVRNLYEQEEEPEKPAVRYSEIEGRLNRLLNTKVSIQDRGNKGKVIINYSSEDTLEKILSYFTAETN